MKRRLFFAIDLSALQREQVATVIEDLRAEDLPWRWTLPDNLHLTLRFLGSTPEESLSMVLRAGEQIASVQSPFELAIQGIGAFPSENRPRSVWVGAKDPSGKLAKLAESLELALRALGFAPDERQFSPHITIARPPERTPDIGLLLARYREQDFGRESIDHLCLFESELRPEGSVYRELRRFEFGKNGS